MQPQHAKARSFQLYSWLIKVGHGVLQGGDGGVGGGGDGGARAGAAGDGACVPGGVSEAAGGGGGGSVPDRGARRGRAEAGRTLRRAAAAPAVRAPRRQGPCRRRAVRGLALRGTPRRRAPARPAPAPPRLRPEEEEMGEGAGLAGRVPAAQRRHGLPGVRLHPSNPAVRRARGVRAGPRAIDSTTRQGLVQLMRHFAGCGNKGGGGGGGGGCPHCKPIFQLLRLHSSVCDRAAAAGEPCRVPLCSNLKTKMQAEKVDKTWRLLVKKVVRAGVMATLANREVPEMVKKSWAKYSSSRNIRAAKFR